MSEGLLRWAQQRLVHHGFTTDVDGMPSAGFRAALATFQRSKGLRATETLTESSVVALRLDAVTGKDGGPAKASFRPVWLAELERRAGLHEVRDHAKLWSWLRSDGKTLGDPAKLPWCGDAIQTAIALTLPGEPQLANPYLARNWLKFGKGCQPKLGSVMVFWRGSRQSTSGHVALYVGEDRNTYSVLGGNQSNAIIVTPIAKDRFLGARWPLTDNTQTFTVERAANDPLSTNEA